MVETKSLLIKQRDTSILLCIKFSAQPISTEDPRCLLDEGGFAQGFCVTECEALHSFTLERYTIKSEILQGLARKGCCIIECERGRCREEGGVSV